MRGVVIENGVEVRLEVPGDGFIQGDRVPCSLTFKNRSGSDVIIETPHLSIAKGTLKLVKAKDADAFEVLDSALLPSPLVIPSGQELLYSHSFALDKNALISERNQSLFLLYGTQKSSSAGGQLPLTVAPHKYVTEVFRTLEMVYSFLPKVLSWKDGYTCMKFTPPTAREFSLVEELVLGVKFEPGVNGTDNLVTRYNFKVKKFEAGGSGVQVKKGKNEYEYVLPPEQYLFGGEFIHQESLEGSISTALKEVATVM